MARAEVNVAVARARVVVAQSEAKRLEAWVGYLKLFAPYDGIIVARNANTWDFVLPNTGDPTAMNRAPHLSPSGQAAPIYVVDRTDIVRIYVDIPERDANYVHIGSEARVKVWAYRDEWLPATVTRLSWALNNNSRTMRAEIDLPNPGSQILPGMYAYGEIVVERPNVLALPKSALTSAGGKSFIWRYENGHALRTEIQTGIRDGEWIEVTNRRIESGSAGEERWVPIDNSEQVLLGSKLSTLTEGAPVRLADSPVADGGGIRKITSAMTGADSTTGTKPDANLKKAHQERLGDDGGGQRYGTEGVRNTRDDRGPIRPTKASGSETVRRRALGIGTVTYETDGRWIRLDRSSRSDHGHRNQSNPRSRRDAQSEHSRGPGRIRPAAARSLRAKRRGGKANQNEKEEGRARPDRAGRDERPVQPREKPRSDQDGSGNRREDAHGQSGQAPSLHPHIAVLGLGCLGLRCRRRRGLLVLRRVDQEKCGKGSDDRSSGQVSKVPIRVDSVRADPVRAKKAVEKGSDVAKLLQVEAAWLAAVQELRQAQAAEKAAQRSEEETKAVLDFLKNTLLSAGHSGDMSLAEAFWAGGQSKDLTLRKAVDASESQVAESFADRPLAEAAVREILGKAYLTLGEPAQSVKQYERAYSLRQAMQGVNQSDAAACRNQLAVAYRLAGRTAEAGRLFDRNPNSTTDAVRAGLQRIDAARSEETRRSRAETARVPDNPSEDPARRLDYLRYDVDARRGAFGSEAIRRRRAVAAVRL